MRDLYEFGHFRLDPDEGRLTLHDVPVSLTPKAFDLLVTLVRRAPRLVTKEQLLREVWPDAFVEEANLTVHISAIRKALGEAAQEGERFIETVPKRGYRFAAAVRVVQEWSPAGSPPADKSLPPAPQSPSDSWPNYNMAGVTLPAPTTPGPTPPVAPDVAAPAEGGWRRRAEDRAAALPAPRRRRWPMLLGALLVVSVVIVLGALAVSRSSFARRGGPAWERMATQGRLSLLSSSEPQTSDPAISADGKTVVYAAADVKGQIDLFLTRIAGGGQLRLTNDESREQHPRFSPDGERLLFMRRVADSNTLQICVMPALGGHEPTVIARGGFPAWSPNGDRIAYIGRRQDGGQAALFTSALDGTDVREVLAGDGDYAFLRRPAWSPDGRELAVVRGRGGISGEIWGRPFHPMARKSPSAAAKWMARGTSGRCRPRAARRGG